MYNLPRYPSASNDSVCDYIIDRYFPKEKKIIVRDIIREISSTLKIDIYDATGLLREYFDRKCDVWWRYSMEKLLFYKSLNEILKEEEQRMWSSIKIQKILTKFEDDLNLKMKNSLREHFRYDRYKRSMSAIEVIVERYLPYGDDKTRVLNKMFEDVQMVFDVNEKWAFNLVFKRLKFKREKLLNDRYKNMESPYYVDNSGKVKIVDDLLTVCFNHIFYHETGET